MEMYHARKTTYADGCISYAICPESIQGRKPSPRPPLDRDPFTNTWIYDEIIEHSSEEIAAKREKSIHDSVYRARKQVEGLARCNKWKYFITLTFDKAKVDRYDYDACTEAIKYWIDCMRRKYPGIKYILVPEPHKDGAWHFHGLVGGCDLDMVTRGKAKGSDGRYYTVYRMSYDDYNLGRTDISMVFTSGRVAYYISKYIRKCMNFVPFGRKRYWASRNLVKVSDCTVKYLFKDVERLLDFIAHISPVADRVRIVFIPHTNKKMIYFTIYSKEGNALCS